MGEKKTDIAQNLIRKWVNSSYLVLYLLYIYLSTSSYMPHGWVGLSRHLHFSKNLTFIIFPFYKIICSLWLKRTNIRSGSRYSLTLRVLGAFQRIICVSIYNVKIWNTSITVCLKLEHFINSPKIVFRSI